MTRRMGFLLMATGVLATLFLLDRFVLNRTDTDDLSAPIARTNKQGTKPVQQTQPGNTYFLAPLTNFDEIWTRPVFMPSRKAAPAIAGPRTQTNSNPSSIQPPDFKIVGVAIGPTNSAVLIREDRRTVKRLYVKDTFDGWTIEEIKADSITVTQGDERWMLPVGAQN